MSVLCWYPSALSATFTTARAACCCSAVRSDRAGPLRGTVVDGKFDQVCRAWLSVKSYSTASRLLSSRVARKASTAATTAAVFAPPGLTPSVLRFTAVTCCMPPGPPVPPPEPPPLGVGDADVDDVVVVLDPLAPQPDTTSTAAAIRPTGTEIFVLMQGLLPLGTSPNTAIYHDITVDRNGRRRRHSSRLTATERVYLSPPFRHFLSRRGRSTGSPACGRCVRAPSVPTGTGRTTNTPSATAGA